MSYDSNENSVDLGSPITLFEFIYGPSTEDVYRYATMPEALVLAGRAWQPANMRHSEIISAGKLDGSELTVSCPNTTPIADLFVAAAPSQQVTLSIWRGHALTLAQGNDDFVRVWMGRVLIPTWVDTNMLELKCEPVATSTRRVGLRRHYQYGCVHVLYDPTTCRVSQPANSASGPLSRVIDNTNMEVTLGVLPPNFTPATLVGGIMTMYLPGGRRVLRSITSAANNGNVWRIGLMSGIPNLATGVTIDLAKGCAHNWDACKGFNNTVNHGGCPNIPTKNPFRNNTF